MDRLRRGESVNEERDRRIEQRAVLLVRAGRDWLTAVVEATREVDGDIRPARTPNRTTRAGKASRTDAIDAMPGGLLARREQSERNDRERAAAPEGDDVVRTGPTLSQSLRAQLVGLLGFDPAGRKVQFAPGTGSAQNDSDADSNEAAPARGIERDRPRTLAETLALLDNPAVSSDFARQAAVAHALLAADAGESLDSGLQAEFGDRLDVALEDVRVHRDPVSSVIVEALGTRAFAFGRHLFFAPGTYAPTTDAGRSLIAHELAHVAQQPAGDVRSAGPVGRGVTLGREGDHYEENADHAAGALLAGLRPQVSRGAPVAARFDGGGSVNPDSVLRKHIGHDEGKAKEALRNAGSKRPMVERIIRDNFGKDRAEDIIKGVKGGGGQAAKPPAVEAKGGAKGGGKADPNAGKAAQKKTDGVLGKGGGGGATKQAGKPDGNAAKMVEGLTGGELSPADRDLIAQELAEHQTWRTAENAVGAPWSAQRAAFVAEQVGRGFGQGFVTGAVMGIGMGIVGQLAQRFCPIPGVGAIIAGGMAAYGLATRDWGQTWDTISNIGQGASVWERIANTLAAISEILDVVVNVMNVVAGIIGLVSAIMWLVTIITVGIASPLAGTLSAIALGILTVSGVIDNINNLIIQPAVIAFRAMHIMNSEADPRQIQGQGAKLADSASKVGSAVGGYLGGRLVEGGAKRYDQRRYGPGGTPGNRPRGSGQTTASPNPAAQAPAAPAAPHAPAGQAPHAPAGQAPHAPAGQPPHAPAGQAPAGQTPHAQGGPNSGQVAASGQAQQRTWATKMGDVRREFGAHRERYAARATEEQAGLARAEDEAHARRTQEIEEARNQQRQEADQRYDQEVAEGRRTAADAAAERARADEARLRDEHTERQQRSQERNAADGQRTEERYQRAKQEATEHHDDANRHISEDRAENNARYERQMSEAAQIQDPVDRARAERWAAESKARTEGDLDGRQRRVDADRQRALDQADQAYAQAKQEDASSVTRRQEMDEQSRQSAERRAAHRRTMDEMGANSTTKNRAENARNREYDAAFEERNRRLRGEPDRAAADARRTASGSPDPGERLGDYWGKNPFKTLRDTWRKQGEMIRGYGDPEFDRSQGWRKAWTRADDPAGGQRSLDQGDVSFKQFNPGFNPGAPYIRDKVEEQAKHLFGTDKKPDAQFLGDHQKLDTGEYKNPHYQDPPAGSLKELDTIKSNWTKALEKQHEAEAAAQDMKQEGAKHQANEAPIDGLHQESKKAIDNTQHHKADVKVKADANVKQTEKQAEASQKIDSYASQQSKFDAVIGPMHGLERFTYLGSRLGVSYFDDMNKSVKKTLGGLEEASAAMKKEQANQGAHKAELKAKAEVIAQTDQKANATDASFKQSETGVLKLKQDNADAVSKAKQAESEATGQKQTYAAKVTNYQRDYGHMAGGLLNWARTHRAARAGQPAQVNVQDGGPQDEHDQHGDADAGAGGDHHDAGAPQDHHAPGAPGAAPGAPGTQAAPPVQTAPPAQSAQPPAPPPPPAMDAGVPAAPPAPQAPAAPPAAPPPPGGVAPRDAGT